VEERNILEEPAIITYDREELEVDLAHTGRLSQGDE
jgi:hypothetical protein